MAYQIDFTAHNYVNRSRRKIFLRLLFLAAVAGAAWGVYDVYITYNQPTLNMKLAEYEAVTRPIEEMNAAWDETAKEWGAMARYYRLIWAANPTNFLNAMASANAPRFGWGWKPSVWTLKTGGECTLSYRFVFDQGDKAERAKKLEAELAAAITSIVEVAGGKVDVQGVQTENLLNVQELGITARFSLPDVRSFPVKEKTLADCVNEIVAMRKKVQETKIADGDGVKGAPSTAQAIMVDYSKSVVGGSKDELPSATDAINVVGFFDNVDKIIIRHEGESKKEMPGKADRSSLKEAWNKIGDARFPWDRFRALDNDELANRTKVLGTVADGVRRFKVFLDQRRADCGKKIEPFIEAYERNDVFNKPFIESDLKDRVAKVAGIVRARIDFNDENNAEPVLLAKDDEKFTFTWVRWKLLVGGDGERETVNGERETGNEEPITLERVADCVKRALELGPGYALDTVKINFREEGGNVSSAVIEGLLPVKKVESTKEATDNVD